MDMATNALTVLAPVPMKTLFGDIFEARVGKTLFAPRAPGEYTPNAKSYYEFELEDIQLLLMWDSDRAVFNRNLMVNGPTGCGKTELIFQFANRTGREVYRYSCHERTEFADLLSSMGFKSDGSTYTMDGPLIQAYRNGGIFVLDEVNAARPGSLIGMNGVMDGADSMVLPGSGEVVHRSRGFRVAITGNGITRDDTSSAFRGTQAMNTAFLDRCFIIEKTYLPALRETKALHDYLVGTTNDPFYNPDGMAVPGNLAANMVAFANAVRQQFLRRECEITISTRGLFAFAEMLAMRWSKVSDPKKSKAELTMVATTTLLGKAAEPMKSALIKSFVTTVVDKVAVTVNNR